MQFKSRLLFATALTAVMGGTALPAMAQDDGIEVITVTAAKREQNVQDVPISMNVIGQQSLEKFNISNLKDISASVPTLHVIRSPADNGLILRGFGSSPANPAFDQTVSLYMDGVYAGRGRQFMSPFFDIERIEVLRGPQGSLLGKNTAAGAISIISAQPKDEFGGSITTSYNFDRQGTDTFGYVTGAITDDLSARLSGQFTQLDGYITNTTTGAKEPTVDNRAARLILKFHPSEDFTNTTKFQYDAVRSAGRAGINIFPVNTPVSTATRTYARAVPGGFGAPGYDKGQSYNFANNAEYSFDGLTLVAITGFSSYESDTLGPGNMSDPVGTGLGTNFVNNFSQVSQEVRLLSPTGEGNPVDWIVGAYVDSSSYRMEDAVRYNVNLGANYNGQTTIHFRMNTFSYSFYANATWHITDDLRILGSARYTHVGKRATYASTVDFGTNLLGAGPRTAAGQIKEDHFDPSLTLQYDIGEDSMLYVSYAKGSKGGSFDSINRSLNPAAFALKPEISTNYEIGAKTQLTSWLQTNIALYMLEFKNLQVAAFDPVLFTNVTRNAGRARSQGVELTFNAHVAEGLNITGSGAYMEAFYTDYPGAACLAATSYYFSLNGPTCPGSPSGNNLRGAHIPFAPTWSGRVNVNYVYPIGDELKVTFDGAANMTSPMWLDATFVPAQRQFGYVKLDARLELAAADDMWAVAVVGKNLNDIHSASQVYTWPFSTAGGPASPSAGYQFDEPRTIAIQGTLKF